MPRSAFGRLGRWCFVHWGWVLAVWVVAVAGGVAASGPMFSRLVDESAPKSAESVAAYSVINTSNGSSGTVVAVVDHVDPAAPAVRDAVAATATRVSTHGRRLIGGPTVRPRGAARTGRRAARARRPGGAHLRHARRPGPPRAGPDRPRRSATSCTALAGALPAGATVEVGGAPLLSLGQRETLAAGPGPGRVLLPAGHPDRARHRLRRPGRRRPAGARRGRLGRPPRWA